MRRYRVVLPALPRAGYGLGEPTGNSPQAVCRRQAYHDPKVKQAMPQSMGELYAHPRTQFEYSKALRTATDACLRRKCVSARGGVEPIERY